MKTATYSDNINTFILPDLDKKINKTSLFVSFLLLVFAGAMFYLTIFTNNDLGDSAEIFAGIIAVGVALYMLIWQRTKLIDRETGSVVSKDRIFYSNDYLQSMLLAFENDNFSMFKNFKRLQDGNVQIIFFLAENYKYIAIQVFKYEPFEYRPQTGIMVYRDANALKLIESLK